MELPPLPPLAPEFPARRDDVAASVARTSAAGSFLPHVVAWNLTRRCNLACAHCYISAGSWHSTAGELDTGEALQVLDQVLDVNASPMLILSGGEPLLRDDLETIAEHAAGRGATVVVGTNGTGLDDARARSLMDAGVQGVAVSVDSLDPRYHDRFRLAAAHDVQGGGEKNALERTLQAVETMRQRGLDFVVQTTLTRGNRSELAQLVEWAADRGAVSFNLYFVVSTGRAEDMPGLNPDENEAVLEELVELERTYRGRMMVRSKCQPQLMRLVAEADDESPLLNYSTRCPCGVHYCRITPEGTVTPCPYSPVVAGDLRTTTFREIWERSPVFHELRHGSLQGKCGVCEYREICGGCRARAYAETGELLGPDSSCAYEPQGGRPVVAARRGLTYGQSSLRSLPWAPEAEARLARIPSFVRGVVAERVESFARDRGYEAVDLGVMREVRSSLPVDFSKRLPFFLRRDEPS